MEELDGRTGVVTGAASGIGRALSRRLAEAGMNLVLADIEPSSLAAAAADLSAGGTRCTTVTCDVSKADDVNRVAEAAEEAFGNVHLVCNNAGVFAGGLSWEAPLSDYEWVLGVNTWGVIHGIRTFVPRMLAHGEPSHVVNTASMAGLTSGPLSGAYFMSKHAVLALSESLFHEMAMQQTRIGVSAVCPELIATRIGDSQRNRPTHLKRDADEALPEGTKVVEGAIREAVKTGVDPDVIATRTVEAIRENRFYVLAPEGNPWREACRTRCEDILAARNPSQGPPAG
jgi:NAD(P)-dependent dehydrogenase (short-subunit alcohol dehydrogenase family)